MQTEEGHAETGQKSRGPWRKLDALAIALPVAVALRVFSAPPALVFIASALAVVPLAGLIGRATEVLAEVVGGSLGALLNATFGTAAEIILGAFLVIDGQIAVLKASLTGSLIGNVLLLLGVAMVVSGWGRKQAPVTAGARGQTTLLFLAVVIFVLPTIFASLEEGSATRVDEVSDAIAIVLVVVYALGLLFMLRTHRSLFRTEPAQEGRGDHAAEPGGTWSTKGAVAVLAVATALTAVAAELVAGSVEQAGAALGLGTGFLGFIVVPLVGNAAEQFSALSLAAKDRLDVAADIAISASLQLVMLVVPLMVLIGVIVGHHVSLTFSTIELAGLISGALLTRQAVDDREGNWFEGVMLIALYLAFAIAVFFVEV